MKKILFNIESKFFDWSVHQWLLLSCLFSLSLLAARVIGTGRLSYGFLAWNLFLAFVPYFISTLLTRRHELLKNRLKSIPLISIWILFMPNSFYILTDLFHLGTPHNHHPWFDLLLIFSFAWNGILFGILSIQRMEKILKKRKGRFISMALVCTVMWLNAVGVYIGRVLRFNSWDIFTNPFSLISETGTIIFDPYAYRYVWAMSICFTFFLTIIYYTITNLGEAVKKG